MKPLASEVLVVTGGAHGIGESIAITAREQGARVGIIDLHATAIADALAVQADLRHAAAIDEAMSAISAELGDITVLVNNAGVNAHFDPVAMTESEWDEFFAVDLKSAWLCSRAVLPGMIRSRRGSIVNISSMHSSLTMRGSFPYAAAKSGLVGLTRSLALDMAVHGIRVNAISPGYTRTGPMEEFFRSSGDPDTEQRVLDAHPLGRIAKPREIANVACFLASDAASFVTGANWAVDGGLGVLAT